MLWEVDIYPSSTQPDRAAQAVESSVRDLGVAESLGVVACRGFLLQGQLERADVECLAEQLFVDTVVEKSVIGAPGDAAFDSTPECIAFPSGATTNCVVVLLKSGVMDPTAMSVAAAIGDFGLQVEVVRTFKKYWLPDLSADLLKALCSKVLANDAIEQVLLGPLSLKSIDLGGEYRYELLRVRLSSLDEESLLRMSREKQLYLSLSEMRTIQNYYRAAGRDPTDIELETLAQTWSEHCSHKTLAGRIEYRDEHGVRHFDNMLKETIFAATQELRRRWGDDDWCVSVFKDNAGIVRFDEQYNVVFKVETHNHPSAIEPYGGANTGLGGVIRDPLGAGLGAKPICSTDVFCFASPDTPAASLPAGVLHPRRVISGVVSGVRDYGNRMGIPTVNGAIYFDDRYLGNPLVFCGNAGLIPRDKSFKQVHAGDLIVAIGGRTGRDGIHGATFSSAELTSESESVSGGAVQIGNAITEKMVLDVVLQARDRQLFNAITDCGAGGFSSAVGEMGEELGAVVNLDRAPLKYAGLSYTEIWISEAQERMVLAVSTAQWPAFAALCASEGVEATVLGNFVPSGKLELRFRGELVGELAMDFLHGGRPPVVRQAEYIPPLVEPLSRAKEPINFNRALLRVLASPNVASKHWVIRQYDHEVQGGSVIKPLVGAANDGPSDAAVLRPVLGSRRGLVIACGMNPRYGDFDCYHMAASAIDEALRNVVAVGGDPARTAILDNFCWGNTERKETLGSLVRAALACHDLALIWETPFISGKDSLNNEFRYVDAAGRQQLLCIPPSLLISAMSQVDDVARCVTMDLKEAGNRLYLVGITKDELGGSHLALVEGLTGGDVPKVDAALAKRIFASLHQAIRAGAVRACHDLSEGGLAVAAAEMAFAGGLGATLHLDRLNLNGGTVSSMAALFAESNTRFLCEVAPERAAQFQRHLQGLPCCEVGQVEAGDRLRIAENAADVPLIDQSIHDLKRAWQQPLDW